MRRCTLLALLLVACRRSPAPSPAGAFAVGAETGAPRVVGCGPHDCRQFASPREAFLAAIAGAPRVIGIGEAHAPRGASVASAATRFERELLPLLQGHASDLLVELMMPPSGCADAAEAVRAEQRPVTSRQAPSDEGEYIALGERARALGIVPDMLRPTCADLAAIRDSADDAVGVSLEIIARLTAAQTKRLVDRNARSVEDRGKIVVVYGGALHNDLEPTPERARWAYAPEVDEYVSGAFVALDLIVPEFIGADDAWRALPWWSDYDRARLGAKTTMFGTGERSFVLVFPETPSLDGGDGRGHAP
jgi:hypothetical protein